MSNPERIDVLSYKKISNDSNGYADPELSHNILKDSPHLMVNNSAGPGGDPLIPASSYVTTECNEAVKLRITAPDPDPPITVVTMLKNTVQKAPNHIALAVKRDGTWKKWTFQEYYRDVVQVAKSFIALGLEPFQSVGILGFNSPEWFLSDLGAIFAGGFATGIYTTNTPEACQYIAINSGAAVIVVENNQMLQKILAVRSSLPLLKAIVQYTGEVAQRDDSVYSWSEFMQKGNNVPDSELEKRIKHLAPNRCCTLIYTSGTTGNPKGVMLSHDAMSSTALKCARAVKLIFGSEVMVSYLPLSHIAAQLLDIYAPITYGVTVYFAQPDALRGSLANTLKEVRPTVFFGVPRVWEKMAEALQAVGRQTQGIKKKLSTWAKRVGLEGNYNRMNGRSVSFSFGIAKKLVFDTIKSRMGFDRCKLFLSGAAPITKETLDYFLSLNIEICEVYGMSESSGPHTFGMPGRNKVTSVGHEMPGAQTKLVNLDADGNGEVCMFGRHVLMGYLNEPEKTAEAVDKDGWLHSGDIGKKDKDGFLYITGRIKELIITAGGENIAPVAVEDAVKEALPVISNCMLIGDKRKFLSMLLTLKTLVDPDTQEPKDELTTAAKDWCQSVGSSARTVSDVINKQNEKVMQAIQRGIDVANKKAVSRAAVIQKWTLLPKDFSIPGGELGPTLKVRRPIVVKMYSKTIDHLYTESD